MKALLWFLALDAAAWAASLQAAPVDAKISFNNQIQPILSEYCYPCHGPDSATRKPKKRPLRLDREQFAFEPRENGKPVIIKSNAPASELVRRIMAKDDDIMPPASEHKTLKPEEIVLLEKWVAQGAQYEKHWSLIQPSRPRLPMDSSGWARNPIDHFVSLKLKENGLKPNPEEHKARLFRRLSFDLIGLPPSPQAVHEFLQDKSPRAYENAADAMLASDQCAEHFTRYWLDAVRYAETQGIHHDHVRSIWPYRDWIIAAFKSNMPFDQFTIEQLAGDLLPRATLEQKIASGYNRLLPTTGEGGAIPDEYAAIYAKDRADTTTAVWLGLTTGCATCHDHKFDPIKMRDFYALTAFFRNNTVPILDNSTNANSAPVLVVPVSADREKWLALEQAVDRKQEAIEQRKKVAKPNFETWLARNMDFHHAGTEPPPPLLSLPLIESEPPFHGSAMGKQIVWPGSKEQHPGPFGPAPRIIGGTAIENAAPEVVRSKGASYGAYILVEDKPNGAIFSRMDKAQGYRGWDLFLTDGRPTIHIIDQYPDAALKITVKEALKAGRWYHVMAVFDGARQGTDALKFYLNGCETEFEINKNTLGPNTLSEAPFRLGARSDGQDTIDAISHGKIFLQDLRFYDHSLSGAEVGQLASAGLIREYAATTPEQRTAEQTNVLQELFLAAFDGPMRTLQGELAALRKEEEPIRARGATSLIMEEKKDSLPVANILLRGNYANKGPEIAAATPEALPPMPPDLPRNRLGFARWLVSRESPLTARVAVNRLWSQIFGIGIVETTEDFGVKGARPANQELLDWLAVEFMESGWDLRHIAKIVVSSATYRQSEVISSLKLQKDPLNKLCSRGPHLRLDAEQIRDQALVASGLLVQKIGGPPVKPYQPEGVWEAVAMKVSNTSVYQQDHGEALYRRSLYTFWKRIAPPPTLEILNAPSREVFCTRRDRTDTPLQAFVTLNDPQFVEAARQLAARALASSKNFDARLDAVTAPLLARRFEATERAIVRRLEKRALMEYQANPSAAQALVAVGESESKKDLPAVELAAWTLVASQVMNLDEALTK